MRYSLTVFSSVINVLKQMVTDEDVLEKEDMHILERIKGFAATIDKEVVPPIPAAKQLLERAVSTVASTWTGSLVLLV
jgi:son of sevenless